jgi:hypothetical protein
MSRMTNYTGRYSKVQRDTTKTPAKKQFGSPKRKEKLGVEEMPKTVPGSPKSRSSATFEAYEKGALVISSLRPARIYYAWL